MQYSHCAAAIKKAIKNAINATSLALNMAMVNDSALKAQLRFMGKTLFTVWRSNGIWTVLKLLA